MYKSKLLGHDFATEITKRVIQYGFRELNLNKIIAITYEENQNSTKSLDLLDLNVQESISKNSYWKYCKKCSLLSI